MKRKWIVVLTMCLFAAMLTGCGATEVKKKTEESAKPEETPEPDIREQAIRYLDKMTEDEKIAQMFIVNMEQLDSSQGQFYGFTDATDIMKNQLAACPVGGVILMESNISNREQTIQMIQNLQSASKHKLFISVDEEGGEVARVANNPLMGTTAFPSMQEIGGTKDVSQAKKVGETIGAELKAIGFNLDFAPVADVRTNESNTEIGTRSFGDDADSVAAMVTEVVKGLQEQSVCATLKHFPGHGDASADSHQGAVDVDNSIMRMRKIDFVPFQAGIKAGADLVMISHISISNVTEDKTPASLSSLVIQDILRKELEFEGLVVTDAMNMECITQNYGAAVAAVKAIEAGNDLILMTPDYPAAFQAVKQALEDGELTIEQIEDSVIRILELKIKRGIIS